MRQRHRQPLLFRPPRLSLLLWSTLFFFAYPSFAPKSVSADMGQSQSRMPEQAITEKLAERLRAMQLEHEKDYLMVETGKCSAVVTVLTETEKRAPAHSEDVSVTATEEWLEDLLADPKVSPSTIAA